jgi:tRNA U55 pseudouridine synthase TruB
MAAEQIVSCSQDEDVVKDNVLICNKPLGITTSVHLFLMKKKYNVKKIAYTGRLDIMAHGKTKYLLNEECRNFHDHVKVNKTYQFDLVFGLQTDSLDSLGFVTSNNLLDEINIKKLDSIIEYYQNLEVYEQSYPIFSTKTIDYKGKMTKLIELYLRKNITPKDLSQELPTDKRNIFYIKKVGELESRCMIKEFYDSVLLVKDPYKRWRKEEVLAEYQKLNMEEKHYVIKLEAKVSSGTYIRQLCHDIGERMDVPCNAYNINRIEIGD